MCVCVLVASMSSLRGSLSDEQLLAATTRIVDALTAEKNAHDTAKVDQDNVPCATCTGEPHVTFVCIY